MSLISRGLGFSRNLLLRGLGNSINEEPVNNYFTVSELNIESNVKTNKYFYPLTGIYSENENVSGWNFSRAIPQDLNSIYERIENSLGGYKNNLEEGTIRNDWKGAVVDSIKLKKIEEKYKKFNRSIWEPILETGTYSIYWFEKYLFSDYSSSILLESKTKQVVIEDGDEDIVVNEIVYTTEIPYGASNISIQNFKRDNYFVNIPYLKYVYDENFENNYSYSVEEIEEISVITVNNYYEKVIGISKQEIESNYNSNNSLIENFEFAGIGTENRSIIYTEFFPIKDVILIEEKKDPEGNTSIEFWEEGEFDYSSSSKKFIVDKFNGKININNSIEKEFYVKKYIEEEKCIEFFKELDLGNSDKGYVKINDVRYQYSNGSNFKIYLITEENLNLNVGEKIVFPQKGSNFSQGSNLWIGYKNIPRVDFEFSENERRGIADLKPYRKVDSSGILEINPYEKHISKLTLEAEMQLEGNMYKTLYMGVDDVKLTAKAVNSHGTPVKENAIDFYCDYGDFSRNSSLTNQNGEATT